MDDRVRAAAVRYLEAERDYRWAQRAGSPVVYRRALAELRAAEGAVLALLRRLRGERQG